jgi:non-heme chloroperoxidase
MSFVTVGSENGHDIELFFEDHGSGRPVVLIHGFPLDGHSWERQTAALLRAGHRVVAYDRRGFGQSSQPTTGYDYDTFTADLHALLEHLDLTDVVLVGHSMGTGEVTRYLATHEGGRASGGVLVSALTPYLVQGPDNPEGVPETAFDAIKAAVDADRFAYLAQFYRDFYRMDLGDNASPETLAANFQVAAAASAWAIRGCVDAWFTDFRGDVAALAGRDVPLLLIHGTEDVITPIANTGDRLPDLLPKLEYLRVDGATHGICWTHADLVSSAVIDFAGR